METSGWLGTWRGNSRLHFGDDKRIKWGRPALRHGIPFTLYAFSDLSTPDLAEYVAFVESPAGQWYSKAVREALVETIDRRCEPIQR